MEPAPLRTVMVNFWEVPSEDVMTAVVEPVWRPWKVSVPAASDTLPEALPSPALTVATAALSIATLKLFARFLVS